MISITVDSRGLRSKLSRFGRVLDSRTLLRAIGLRQIGWITTNFDRSGALAGGWQPLSPNTIAGRRHGGSRPLQDTGRLKQSFVSGPDNVFELTADSVTIGSNVLYAAAHNEGVSPAQINPIRPTTPRVRIGTDEKGRPIFRGGVLAFKTAKGWVFVTEVRNHPGIPKRRMLPTANEARQLGVSVIEGAIKKLEKQEESPGG